ncbi:MAG: ABC-ATPase domain-containing protein, partial [Myxococcales bacterium]|nr:ABC-ATPase domain-containing protein [Myxococcales bacterium]
VQGDPFAAPSRIRLRLSGPAAQFPASLRRGRTARVALADLLARRVRGAIQGRPSRADRAGSGNSGRIEIDAGGQEVLERTAIRLGEGFVEARLRLGLPARGRTILGSVCARLLCETIPELAAQALVYDARDSADLAAFVRCVEDQEALRAQLEAAGLVAFVADGSVLPRASGVSDRPLASGVIPTAAPKSMRCALRLADGREVVGLGVPAGVTLIVGGGFHGKSTLLQALSRAVYPHVPGDGRERVVTHPAAVVIRAEEGRRIEACDIGAFISELPGGRDTRCFSTENASGSTSQAASISEALEVGARVLLMDEDTCASNFMIRDERMRELIAPEREPITPLIDRVRQLWEASGVSTVLVMGGSGDYFSVADRVIEMRDYALVDRSADAARISRGRTASARTLLPFFSERFPETTGLTPRLGKRERAIDARDVRELRYGDRRVRLEGLPLLVDRSQVYAVGCALDKARSSLGSGLSLVDALRALERTCDEAGLEAWVATRSGEEHPGELARPRGLEIAGVWNRLRGAAFGRKA